jgi:AraC family ethanolamine operon transcriptional activator
MGLLEPGTRAQSGLEHLSRLRQLISRIGTRDASGFVDPAAARAAEEDVLGAAVEAIEMSSVTRKERHAGRPLVARSRVIAAMIDMIDAKQGEPLFVAELCRQAKVSERTLRNICQEYFGVGPIRLLKARQLLEIRRALLASEPGQEAVGRIAASYGVWDFSLFARHYRTLYGEAPSQSLRKRPSRSPASSNASWLGYVARMFASR